MAHKVGPKEQQRIALRLKRYDERGPGSARRNLTEAKASKPNSAPVPASAQNQENVMKKAKKKPAKPAAKKRGRSEAAANLKAAKKVKVVSTGEANRFKVIVPKTKKKAAAGTVPALDVANFMAREGGASMAELVEKFGIDAHPMRAKVHYIRNQIDGWSVETKDGRYYATGPKAA
jgi:predicted trehalose synthase